MRKIIEKSVDTVPTVWIIRFNTQQQDTLMTDFINNNADLVVWSIILAPFAYYGVKLALVMAYVIIAGIFGENK